MDHILRDLYQGKYAAFEKPLRQTTEYRQTLDIIIRIEAAFKKELPPELYSQFKDYMEAMELLSCLNDEEVFIEGFRLAIQLMVAGLSIDISSMLSEENK